jgi:hypothetical protein
MQRVHHLEQGAKAAVWGGSRFLLGANQLLGNQPSPFTFRHFLRRKLKQWSQSQTKSSEMMVFGSLMNAERPHRV